MNKVSIALHVEPKHEEHVLSHLRDNGFEHHWETQKYFGNPIPDDPGEFKRFKKAEVRMRKSKGRLLVHVPFDGTFNDAQSKLPPFESLPGVKRVEFGSSYNFTSKRGRTLGVVDANGKAFTVMVRDAKLSDARDIYALQVKHYPPHLRASLQEIRRRIETLPSGMVKIAKLVDFMKEGTSKIFNKTAKGETVGWTYVVPTDMRKYGDEIASNPVASVKTIHVKKGRDAMWGDLIAQNSHGLDISLYLTDEMLIHLKRNNFRWLFGKPVSEKALKYDLLRGLMLHSNGNVVARLN